MLVEGTLHLQHELKALQSFVILAIGTEVEVCTTRDGCQLDNSWIIWGELIHTGSFNNCSPGVQKCSWIFLEFFCVIFHIKSHIEFGWYLCSTGKRNSLLFLFEIMFRNLSASLFTWISWTEATEEGNSKKKKMKQINNRENLEHYL